MRVLAGPIEQWTFATGNVAVDPDSISAITRPDGGGATVEDIGSILANKKETGWFYADTTDGSYSVGTYYELYATITKDSETWYRTFKFRHTAASSAIDPVTSIAVANDGDGDAITITIVGTAGVTYQTLYQESGDGTWTEGESRSGSGEIAQAGLDNDTWYHVCVVGTDGTVYSEPSDIVAIYVTDGSSSMTGDITGTMDNLRTLIATTDTFQAWVEATGDAAERLATAKAAIALAGIRLDTSTMSDADKRAAWSAQRPFAIISMSDDWAKTTKAEGGPHGLGCSLFAYFEADVGEDDVHVIEDPFVEFANILDAIITEMLAVESTSGYLRIGSVRIVAPPLRADKRSIPTMGDHQLAAIEVTTR